MGHTASNKYGEDFNVSICYKKLLVPKIIIAWKEDFFFFLCILFLHMWHKWNEVQNFPNQIHIKNLQSTVSKSWWYLPIIIFKFPLFLKLFLALNIFLSVKSALECTLQVLRFKMHSTTSNLQHVYSFEILKFRTFYTNSWYMFTYLQKNLALILFR